MFYKYCVKSTLPAIQKHGQNYHDSCHDGSLQKNFEALTSAVCLRRKMDAWAWKMSHCTRCIQVSWQGRWNEQTLWSTFQGSTIQSYDTVILAHLKNTPNRAIGAHEAMVKALFDKWFAEFFKGLWSIGQAVDSREGYTKACIHLLCSIEDVNIEKLDGRDHPTTRIKHWYHVIE